MSGARLSSPVRKPIPYSSRALSADTIAGGTTFSSKISAIQRHRGRLLSTENMEAEIAALAKRAASRNIENAIAGALAFPGEDFAQLIEGRRASADRLMTDIRVDIVILRAVEEAARRFAAWSRTYWEAPVAAIVDRPPLATMNGLERGSLRLHQRTFRTRGHWAADGLVVSPRLLRPAEVS